MIKLLRSGIKLYEKVNTCLVQMISGLYGAERVRRIYWSIKSLHCLRILQPLQRIEGITTKPLGFMTRPYVSVKQHGCG